MKMNDTMEKQSEVEKKPSRKKYTLTAVAVFLLMTALVCIWLTQKQKSDPASEAIIRQVVAKQLNKTPNDLSDEDFAKIIKLDISSNELSDIKFLAKLINLQTLRLEFVKFPDKAIPKWMKVLEKLGILDLSERFSLDLTPLESLTKLQELNLLGTQVSNLEPITNLTNLRVLNIAGTRVSSLEPLKGLTKLERLNIQPNDNITAEQLKELKSAIPNLNVEFTLIPKPGKKWII
jgi:internalin A